MSLGSLEDSRLEEGWKSIDNVVLFVLDIIEPDNRSYDDDDDKVMITCFE